MFCKKALFPIILLALCLLGGPVWPADIRSFTVQFAGCTEFAGWGPVSLAKAQLLVPPGYVVAGAGPGQAGIVVRATSCDAVSIGQSPAQPTVVSQIGINLDAPDGTGDINNYTLIYVTNNPALAAYLQIGGLPAVFDPELTYEYTPSETSSAAGQLYVTAAGAELPAYFLFGTESDPPPDPQRSFLANWWFTGDAGKMKQSTSFPVISFGSAAVTLYASKNSPLGDLIGGNTDSDFSILSVRGVYAAATMNVTLSRAGGG